MESVVRVVLHSVAVVSVFVTWRACETIFSSRAKSCSVSIQQIKGRGRSLHPRLKQSSNEGFSLNEKLGPREKMTLSRNFFWTFLTIIYYNARKNCCGWNLENLGLTSKRQCWEVCFGCKGSRDCLIRNYRDGCTIVRRFDNKKSAKVYHFVKYSSRFIISILSAKGLR